MEDDLTRAESTLGELIALSAEMTERTAQSDGVSSPVGTPWHPVQVQQCAELQGQRQGASVGKAACAFF